MLDMCTCSNPGVASPCQSAAQSAAATDEQHPQSCWDEHQHRYPPLTALAVLGQQRQGGEGLEAKLVGRKVALHVSLQREIKGFRMQPSMELHSAPALLTHTP